MQKRSHPTRVIAAITLILLTGCVQANNPYDLDAPAHLQLDGQVMGRIVLKDHNFDEQPVVIDVLDQSENPVQDENGPIQITTRTSDSSLPGGFEDDGLGVAGTFALTLPPSEAPYILKFDSPANNLALYESTQKMVWVFPDASIQIELSPLSKGQDAYTGTVTVAVEGTEAGNSFLVSLEPKSDTAGAQTQSLSGSADGTFSFENVLPGAVYQVKVSGDAYLPITSALFVVSPNSTALTTVDEVDWNPCDGTVCDVGTLKMATLGKIFEIDYETLAAEDGSAAPYTRRTQIPVKLSVSQLFLSEDNGLPYTLFIQGQSAWAHENGLVDEAGYVAVDTSNINQETTINVDLLEGRDSIEDGAHAILVQLKVCPVGLESCYESGKAQLSITLDRTPPTASSITVENLNEDQNLNINCARYSDTQCPPPGTSSVFTPTIEGMLYDRHSPIIGYTFTKNQNDATGDCPETFEAGNLCPEDFQVLDSEAGYTVLPTSNGPAFAVEDITEASESHTIEVWAKDAAGNIGLVHIQNAVADLTPIDVAQVDLNIAPSISGTVDGETYPLLIEDLITATLDADNVNEAYSWQVTHASGLSVGMNEPVSHAGPVSLVITGLHRETVELSLRMTDGVGNAAQKTLNPYVIWKKGNVQGTLIMANGASPATATLQLSNSETTVTTSANEAGAFVFEEVGAGAWQFDAIADALETVSLPSVSVSNGETTNLGLIELADNTDPMGSFTLNAGATTTNQPNVTITLSELSDDAHKIWVSQSDFVSTSMVSPPDERNLPLTDETETFNLTGDDGEKTVYVRIFDSAGNFIDRQSNIVLDQTAPTSPVLACTSCDWEVDGILYTNNANPTLSLSADDSTSGFSGFTLQQCDAQGENCSEVTETLPANVATTLPLETSNTVYTIKGQATDEAGNLSAVHEIQILYTEETPSFSVSLNPDSDITNHTSAAYIDIQIEGPIQSDNTLLAPLVSFKIASTDLIGTTDWEHFTEPLVAQPDAPETILIMDYLLPNPETDETKTLAIYVADAAGNTASLETSVTLDRDAPSFSSITAGSQTATNDILYFNATDLAGGEINIQALATDELTGSDELRYVVTDGMNDTNVALGSCNSVRANPFTDWQLGTSEGNSWTICDQVVSADPNCDSEFLFNATESRYLAVYVIDQADNCTQQTFQVVLDQTGPSGRRLEAWGDHGEGQVFAHTGVMGESDVSCNGVHPPLYTSGRTIDLWWRSNDETIEKWVPRGYDSDWASMRFQEVTVNDMTSNADDIAVLLQSAEWESLVERKTYYLENEECDNATPCLFLLGQAKDLAGNETDTFCIPVYLDETAPAQPVMEDLRAFASDRSFATESAYGNAKYIQVKLANSTTNDHSFLRYIVQSEQIADEVTLYPDLRLNGLPQCDAEMQGLDLACEDELGDGECALNNARCLINSQADPNTFVRILKSDFRNVIQVRTEDIAGNMSEDTLIIFEEDNTPPSRPTGLEIEETIDSLHLSWSPSASNDVDYYEVHYGTLSGSLSDGNYTGFNASNGESPLSAGQNTSFTLFGLPEGTRTYVAIKAVDRAGLKSEFSSEASGVPSAFAPKLISQIGGNAPNIWRNPNTGHVFVPEDNGLSVYELDQATENESANHLAKIGKLPDVVQINFGNESLYVHSADPKGGPVRSKGEVIFHGLPNENAPIRTLTKFNQSLSDDGETRYIKDETFDLPDDTAFFYIADDGSAAVSGTLGVRLNEGDIPVFNMKESSLSYWEQKNGRWTIRSTVKTGRAIGAWQHVGDKTLVYYSYELPPEGTNSQYSLWEFLALPIKMTARDFTQPQLESEILTPQVETSVFTNAFDDGLIVSFGEIAKIGNRLVQIFPMVSEASTVDILLPEDNEGEYGIEINGHLNLMTMGPSLSELSDGQTAETHPLYHMDGSLQTMSSRTVSPYEAASEDVHQILLNDIEIPMGTLLWKEIFPNTALNTNDENAISTLVYDAINWNMVIQGFTLLDFIENGHLNGKSIQVGNENAFITRAEILDSQALLTLSNAITLSPGETNATIALDSTPNRQNLSLENTRFDVQTLPRFESIIVDGSAYLLVGNRTNITAYEIQETAGQIQISRTLKAACESEPELMKLYEKDGEIELWVSGDGYLQHYYLSDFSETEMGAPTGGQISINSQFGFVTANHGFLHATPYSKTSGSVVSIDITDPSRPITTNRIALSQPVVALQQDGSRLYAITNQCTGNANNGDDRSQEDGATGLCNTYDNVHDTEGVYRCGCEGQAHLASFSLSPTDPTYDGIWGGTYPGRPHLISEQPLVSEGENLNYINGLIPWGDQLLLHRYAASNVDDTSIAPAQTSLLQTNALDGDVPGTTVDYLWTTQGNDTTTNSITEQFAFARLGNYLFATVGKASDEDFSCVGIFEINEDNNGRNATLLQVIEDSCVDNSAVLFMQAAGTSLYVVESGGHGLSIYDLKQFMYQKNGNLDLHDIPDGYDAGQLGYLCQGGNHCVSVDAQCENNLCTNPNLEMRSALGAPCNSENDDVCVEGECINNVCAQLDGANTISNVSKISNYSIGSPFKGGLLHGNYFYLMGNSALHAIDVSDVNSPKLGYTFDVSATSVAAESGYLYVATEKNGLRIYELLRRRTLRNGPRFFNEDYGVDSWQLEQSTILTAHDGYRITYGPYSTVDTSQFQEYSLENWFANALPTDTQLTIPAYLSHLDLEFHADSASSVFEMSYGHFGEAFTLFDDAVSMTQAYIYENTIRNFEVRLVDNASDEPDHFNSEFNRYAVSLLNGPTTTSSRILVSHTGTQLTEDYYKQEDYNAFEVDSQWLRRTLFALPHDGPEHPGATFPFNDFDPENLRTCTPNQDDGDAFFTDTSNCADWQICVQQPNDIHDSFCAAAVPRIQQLLRGNQNQYFALGLDAEYSVPMGGPNVGIYAFRQHNPLKGLVFKDDDNTYRKLLVGQSVTGDLQRPLIADTRALLWHHGALLSGGRGIRVLNAVSNGFSAPETQPRKQLYLNRPDAFYTWNDLDEDDHCIDDLKAYGRHVFALGYENTRVNGIKRCMNEINDGRNTLLLAYEMGFMSGGACRAFMGIQGDGALLGHDGHCLISVAQTELPAETRAMTVHGNQIYVIGGYGDSQVYIYNLKLPDNRGEVPELELVGSAESGGTHNKNIEVHGGFLFVNGDNGLHLLDGR